MRENANIAVSESKHQLLSILFTESVKIGAVEKLHLDRYLHLVGLKELLLQIRRL